MYAAGTTCTYEGTPATQNVAIPYPITANVQYDLTNLVTYSSNDPTACPTNQLFQYYDSGSGIAFQAVVSISTQVYFAAG